MFIFSWWVLLLENSLLQAIVKGNFLMLNCIIFLRQLLMLFPVHLPLVYFLNSSTPDMLLPLRITAFCLCPHQLRSLHLSSLCITYITKTMVVFSHTPCPPAYCSSVHGGSWKAVLHPCSTSVWLPQSVPWAWHIFLWRWGVLRACAGLSILFGRIFPHPGPGVHSFILLNVCALYGTQLTCYGCSW